MSSIDSEPNNTQSTANQGGFISTTVNGGSVNSFFSGAVATGGNDLADYIRYTFPSALQSVQVDIDPQSIVSTDILAQGGVSGVTTRITISPEGGFSGQSLTVEARVGSNAYADKVSAIDTGLTQLTSSIYNEYNAKLADGVDDQTLITDINRIADLVNLFDLYEQSGVNAIPSVTAANISARANSYTSGSAYLSQIKNYGKQLADVAIQWASPLYFLDRGSGLQQLNAFAIGQLSVTWATAGSPDGVGYAKVTGSATTQSGIVQPARYSGDIQVQSETGDTGNHTFYIGPGTTTIAGAPGNYNLAVFSGNSSNYTISRSDGALRVTASGLTATLSNFQGLAFDNRFVKVKPPASDFNGDGKSDILFQSTSNGNVADWVVQNGMFASYNNLGNAGGYKVVGTGTFDLDSTADVLFQDASGNVADWIVNDGKFSSYNNVGNAGGYKVVGIGNFNGDSTSDILFQDASGNVAVWTMEDGRFLKYFAVGNAGAYKVVGTGDFNGDGTTDILFQDAAGNVADWIMESGLLYTADWDTRNVAFAIYNNIGNAGGYKVVGTGDVNADGTADIVFQNASGQVADWTIQNGKFSYYNNVGNAGGYSVVGTADYNGDGTADVLFQNAGGQVVNWTLKNGQFNSYNNVGTAAGYKAS
jgi:hypothetical protein